MLSFHYDLDPANLAILKRLQQQKSMSKDVLSEQAYLSPPAALARFRG